MPTVKPAGPGSPHLDFPGIRDEESQIKAILSVMYPGWRKRMESLVFMSMGLEVDIFWTPPASLMDGTTVPMRLQTHLHRKLFDRKTRCTIRTVFQT